MSRHLVILKTPYLERIVSGRKTIELRLTRAKGPAFDHVEPGDRLSQKISAGPVIATATVDKAERHENLTREKIGRLKARYNDRIGGSDAGRRPPTGTI